MDTKQFLDVVLPTAGQRCVGAPIKGEFTHFYGKSNEWAAEAVRRIDSKQIETYFALGGFGSERNRTQANVVAVRSFWLDIDTNENGKGKSKYADRKEALAALMAFRSELGLPTPWIVSSGYGLHVYWPCDEDMTPDAWRKTAELLKKATKVWGLDADPTRTADHASILRPPGANNYKRGNIKPVKLVKQGDVTQHHIVHMQVENFLASRNAMPQERVENINGDLMTTYESAPSDPNKIADACAVMGEMRSTRGNVEEPLWYGCLGILAHTTDGETVSHEWSSGHPSYSKRETARKLEQVKSYGPTTCEKLSDHRFSACQSCPHWGKIKSPIVLGRGNREEQTIPSSMLPDDVHIDLNTLTRDLKLPHPFAWGESDNMPGRKTLYKSFWEEIDDEGDDGSVGKKWIERKTTISTVLFYPVARVQERRGLDALYSMSLIMVDDFGNRREFTLDLGMVADASKMAQELSRREIAVTQKNKPEVINYLAAWIDKLREEYANTPMIEQFGWVNDGFVVGNSYITKDGERRAILTNSANSYTNHMETKGELGQWVHAVDKAYNHPGQEALQFLILCSFAAPLWSLFGESGGCTVFAYGGSGVGKTTATKVGMSAWGHHPKLVLHESNFTEAGLYQHMGIMRNLPVIIDEMTKCSPEFASRLAFTMSGGTGKLRLNSDSSIKKMLDWSTIALASGNNMLTEKIAQSRADAEAELNRVWEFEVSNSVVLNPNEALEWQQVFVNHYGHPGRVFAKYIVDNREKVEQLLLRTRVAFNTQANISGPERYWSQLHACVLTALAICSKLDLLKFDRTNMVNWIIQNIDANRKQIVSNVSDPLEQFGDMLSDIWGGMLVTHGEGNLASNSGYVNVLQDPRGPITGRYILKDPHDANCTVKLLISTAVAKDWCVKNQVSFKTMHQALVAAGYATNDIKRISLGKGTEKYSGVGGPVKCLVVDPDKVMRMVGSAPVARKITAVIDGGLNDAATGTDD